MDLNVKVAAGWSAKLNKQVKPGELPYAMREGGFAHYDKIKHMSPVFKSALGQRLLNSDSVNDVATYVAKYGKERFARYSQHMKYPFGDRGKCNHKEGVPRIAEKITEAMLKYDVPAKEAWGYLTDILRMQLFCKTPEEVVQNITRLLGFPDHYCEILRFKPRFKGYLKDMILNINWLKFCCCEIQIKLGDGSVSRGYSEQHFIFEVVRSLESRDFFSVQDVFYNRVNHLINNDQIIWDDRQGNCMHVGMDKTDMVGATVAKDLAWPNF